MKATTPRLVRWALRLAEYDFSIKYKRGDENLNVDALSRQPTLEVITNITILNDEFKQRVVFTSWPEAIPLKSLTAQEKARALQILITRQACPNKVITDKGTSFMSNLFNKLCKQYNIEHIQSSAYHHQTIGKVERLQKFIENSLSTLLFKDQTNWPNMLESCLFVYRITFNRNLAEIPFYLLYGRDAILLQVLMITHKHRINRQKASDDIDIYKPMLLNTLRLAYEKLQEH
jgi:transposase InsO family protein